MTINRSASIALLYAVLLVGSLMLASWMAIPAAGGHNGHFFVYRYGVGAVHLVGPFPSQENCLEIAMWMQRKLPGVITIAVPCESPR